MFELLQGYVLFNGKQDKNGAWTAEEDHLAQMIELLGPIPPDVLSQGSLSSQYFDDNGM
jgi:serine/threonine-protein kinase SRPK3